MTLKMMRKVFSHPAYFLAFGFGSGLAPVLPGTCGTLVALPIYWILILCPKLLYLGLILLALGIGIVVTDWVAKDMGEHDYCGIVWDEIVGYLITMFAIPFNIKWMILGFLLFRLFDIWKPYPIRWFDKNCKGGLGIMLDDVLAGIFAWISLQVLMLMA